MARFEHRRYPAITLQDNGGIWAVFTPEERTFGEHTVHVGVFDTTDETLIARLRACPDPDLVEVRDIAPAPVSTEQAPTGGVPAGMSVQATIDWVAGDKNRAQAALDAEKAGQNRATLIDRLEKVLDA